MISVNGLIGIVSTFASKHTARLVAAFAFAVVVLTAAVVVNGGGSQIGSDDGAAAADAAEGMQRNALNVGTGAMGDDADATSETAPAAGERRADMSCANRPKGREITTPKLAQQGQDSEGDLTNFLFYSNAADNVLVEKTQKVMSYWAGPGDDSIYVYGPQAGTVVLGEGGGDTFLVCSLGDLTTMLDLGPTDTAADTVVIDPGIFTNAPAGNATLSIAGFVSVNDRLVLRVPDGAEVKFGDLEITVGSVKVKISPGTFGTATGESGDFNLESITIMAGPQDEAGYHPPKSIARTWGAYWRRPKGTTKVGSTRAATLAGTSVTGINAAAGCKEPGRTAGRSVPPKRTALESVEGRYEVYGDRDDVIVSTDKSPFTAIDGGAGDDRFYVFNPVSGMELTGGPGADSLTVCAIEGSEIYLRVVMGDATGFRDADADTLILNQGVFQDVQSGFEREIHVYEFVSANDRLVLQLPPGTTVAFEDGRTGSAHIRVGNVLILVFHTGGLDEPFDWNSVVVVPTTATDVTSPKAVATVAVNSAQAKAWRWGEPETLSGKKTKISKPPLGCSELRSPAPGIKLTKPFEEMVPQVSTADYRTYYRAYTHGDDLIRLAGTRKTTWARAGGGEDAIYLFDVGDHLRVEAGSGPDLIVLCSMHGVELLIWPGTEQQVDGQPDIIIIEPAVFLDVPKGLVREIKISGFLPINDRVVLRVPQGLKVEGKLTKGWIYTLKVGQTLISIDDGNPLLETKFDEKAIVVVPSSAG